MHHVTSASKHRRHIRREARSVTHGDVHVQTILMVERIENLSCVGKIFDIVKQKVATTGPGKPLFQIGKKDVGTAH